MQESIEVISSLSEAGVPLNIINSIWNDVQMSPESIIGLSNNPINMLNLKYVDKMLVNP